MLTLNPKLDPVVAILMFAYRRGLALRQVQVNGAEQSKEKAILPNGFGEQIGKSQESLQQTTSQQIGDGIKRLRFKKHTRLRKQKPKFSDAKISQVSELVDYPDLSGKCVSALDAVSGDVEKV